MLSALGEQQSRVLGSALAARGVTPRRAGPGLDATAPARPPTARSSAAGWDRRRVTPGWDEFDHLEHARAAPADSVEGEELTREEFQALVRGGHRAVDRRGLRRRVRRELRGLRRAGRRGACGATVERLGPQQTAVVLTSGGPIAWVAGRPARRRRCAVWRRLNRVTVNAAVTKVRRRSPRLTLVSFNDHSPPRGPSRATSSPTGDRTSPMTQDDPDHRRELRPRRRDGPPVRRPGHDLALCARRTDRLEALRGDPRGAPRRTGGGTRARRERPRPVFEVFRAFRRRPRHASTGWSSTPAWARARRSAPAASSQPADRDDQLRRRAGPDRGRDGDLPRPGRRSPGDDLVDVGDARHARAITTYAATKAGVAHLAEGVRADCSAADQGHGDLPRVHPVGDERDGREPRRSWRRPRRASGDRRAVEKEKAARPGSRRGRGCRWGSLCAPAASPGPQADGLSRPAAPRMAR